MTSHRRQTEVLVVVAALFVCITEMGCGRSNQPLARDNPAHSIGKATVAALSDADDAAAAPIPESTLAPVPLNSLPQGVVEATLMSGSDIGAQLNAAYAALPSSGGQIHVASAAACYRFETPIVFATVGKIVRLESDANGACLQFMKSNGVALTVNAGSAKTNNHYPSSFRNLKLVGPGYATATTGIQLGGMAGGKSGATASDGQEIDGLYVTKFGVGVSMVDLSYLETINNATILANGLGLLMNTSELVRVNNSVIAQNRTCGLQMDSGYNNEISVYGVSFDDNTNFGGHAICGEGLVEGESLHFENVAKGTAQYIAMTGGALYIYGGEFVDDRTTCASADPQMILLGGSGQVFFHVDHPFVFSRTCRTDEFLNISNDFGGGGEITLDNDSTALISSDYKVSGSGHFRIIDFSSTQASREPVNFAVGGIRISDPSASDNPRFVLRSFDNHTADSILDLSGVGSSARTRLYAQGKGPNPPLILGSWDSLGDFSPGSHLNQSGSREFGGTCVMASNTTCTIAITRAYDSPPICIVTIQSSDVIAGGCTVSKKLITITAASPNSSTWGAMLIGNPN